VRGPGHGRFQGPDTLTHTLSHRGRGRIRDCQGIWDTVQQRDPHGALRVGGRAMRATEQLRKDNAALWEALANLQRAVLRPGADGALRMRNVLRYLRTEVLGDAGMDEALFLDRLGHHGRLGEVARLLRKERRALRAQLDELIQEANGLRELGALDSQALAVRAQCENFIRDFLHHLFVEDQVLLPEAEACLEPERLEEVGAVMAALRRYAQDREEAPALD